MTTWPSRDRPVRFVAVYFRPIATQVSSIAREVSLVAANVAIGALGPVNGQCRRRSGRSASVVLCV
jgi:hypothetical protein